MSAPLAFSVVVEENAATVTTVAPQQFGVNVAQNTAAVVVVPAQPFTVVTVDGPPGPRGTPGTGAQVVGEIPTGVVDGVNHVFTFANVYAAGTTAMYLNGLRGVRGGDFSETPPNQITLSFAPLPGDSLAVDYFVG